MRFCPSYTPGLPQASWLNEDEALALSRLGALEALRAGCTTLVDSFVHAEATVAGMAETGVRLFASQRLADVDFASVLEGDRRFDRARGERQWSAPPRSSNAGLGRPMAVSRCT